MKESIKRFLLSSIIPIFLLLSIGSSDLLGQHSSLTQKIAEYKNDNRGPFKDIRWFCNNGINLPAKERCPDTTGYQKARLKDELETLAKNKRVYFGQILMGNTKDDFLDRSNDYSRAKQYLLEKYLFQIDDGWILRKAQYYRGAIQDEDENKWGAEFLQWLFNNKNYTKENFYLFREFCKQIPHGEENNLVSKIRALSLNLSERHTSFMDVRTKLHGNLEAKDSIKVTSYLEKHSAKLKDKDRQDFLELNELIVQFSNQSVDDLIAKAKKIKSTASLRSDLENIKYSILIKDYERLTINIADLLSLIKGDMNRNIEASDRLTLMDLSIQLEQMLLSKLSLWNTQSLESHLAKSCYLSQLLNATGYTYDWEFEELLKVYTNQPIEQISFKKLLDFYDAIRRNINWGSALIITEFGQVIEEWSEFENLSEGFIDDRIRSSFLLGLGAEASYLNEVLNKEAKWKNAFFDLKTTELSVVNPGLAKGILIFDNPTSEEKKNPEAIYVFRKPPADLEPIAGVFSISEGNMVSHLQLLSKNLGIPNINITENTFQELKKYEGKIIFMAASPLGGIKIKLANDLSSSESDLFKKKEINEGIITVPIEQIELDNKKIISLSDLDAKDSGILCGPKAANYARLKKMFPNNMVDGFVIPFSVFKDHMDQTIKGKDLSYWTFLEQSFNKINDMKTQGVSQSELDELTLKYLEELRGYIKEIPLKNSLISDLEDHFKSTFGKALGDQTVFLRSDTNMEDLKDFTGAGLNMTLFNVLEKNKILQGIRDVWTSPYSERSYKWRQKFLTNPENVFPSILIIPSVNVDYSGVIISKDFVSLQENALNVAFSQGVGGAVDGQKSESWILMPNGNQILVTPSRDRNYKYLKSDGTIQKGVTSLESNLLNVKNIKSVWEVIYEVKESMPKIGMQGPYDIELGFQDDKLWLFQIRPFVENKKANFTNYLTDLNPSLPLNSYFKLNANYVQ